MDIKVTTGGTGSAPPPPPAEKVATKATPTAKKKTAAKKPVKAAKPVPKTDKAAAPKRKKRKVSFMFSHRKMEADGLSETETLVIDGPHSSEAEATAAAFKSAQPGQNVTLYKSYKAGALTQAIKLK